jgi:hypothetical protein
MVAGGIGVISTYQTGLVVAGILLIDLSFGEASPSGSQPTITDAGEETPRLIAVGSA